MAAARFLYGTLRHVPLLRAVLGRETQVRRARLPGHRALGTPAEAFPLVAAVPGADGVEGVLAPGLTDEDMARLDFFESGCGGHVREERVTLADGGAHLAQIRFPEARVRQAGERWDFEAWVERWGETAVAAARDFMSHYPGGPVGVLRGRAAQMLTRVGSEVRAARLRPGTETLRRRAAADDISVHALRHPYLGFFAVEERDLRHRRFDGSMSAVLNRAVFTSGDAAVVLPYDPVRDRVLLIEQFRAGPHARGNANPWLVETVAGRIDGGETPEQAARREAVEEAGLTLTALMAGPRYYPSPAATGEYIYSFVGIADLPDGAAGIGGLAGEAEDIRSHVISFARLMELVVAGEIDNAPLIILAYWLERERPRLRAGAAGV